MWLQWVIMIPWSYTNKYSYVSSKLHISVIITPVEQHTNPTSIFKHYHINILGPKGIHLRIVDLPFSVILPLLLISILSRRSTFLHHEAPHKTKPTYAQPIYNTAVVSPVQLEATSIT